MTMLLWYLFGGRWQSSLLALSRITFWLNELTVLSSSLAWVEPWKCKYLPLRVHWPTFLYLQAGEVPFWHGIFLWGKCRCKHTWLVGTWKMICDLSPDLFFTLEGIRVEFVVEFQALLCRYKEICRLIYARHLNISSMVSICQNQLRRSVLHLIELHL